MRSNHTTNEKRAEPLMTVSFAVAGDLRACAGLSYDAFAKRNLFCDNYDLWVNCKERDLTEEFSGHDYRILKAVDTEQNMHGYLGYTALYIPCENYTASIVSIGDLYTLPSDAPTAKILLDYFLETKEAQTCDAIELFALKDVQPIYQRYGFEICADDMMRLYPKGRDHYMTHCASRLDHVKD